MSTLARMLCPIEANKKNNFLGAVKVGSVMHSHIFCAVFCADLALQNLVDYANILCCLLCVSR
jgi:hypothetical protein